MLILFKDGETSIILSAKVAWASSDMSGPVDASIILIDGGRRWWNNSRINALSICCTDSPNSLCIYRNNWLGVRSPSSTVVRRVWSLLCPDTVVRRRSFSFSIEKGWSAGGEINNVPHFHRNVLGKRRDHVFVICSLVGNSPCSEL